MRLYDTNPLIFIHKESAIEKLNSNKTEVKDYADKLVTMANNTYELDEYSKARELGAEVIQSGNESKKNDDIAANDDFDVPQLGLKDEDSESSRE